ncbi:ParA family protein [Tautonia marina]|uniref:ParA family protein n=1 Tax=Tautonia marina TaxID=2653855 RepID=UPI001260C18E|nr:ParA family protein [Tautonia marina]
MPAATICFLNQKGGVGKTSSVYHLGGTLARDGARVLCLDMDPQASLTQGFFGPDAMRARPAHETIAGLFGDGIIPAAEDLIVPTAFERLAIVPGSVHLTRHNVPEPWDAPDDQQRALAEFVSEAADRFDWILIDCPPNLHLCAWASLAASDHIVVPLQAEDFGSQGVAAILDCIDAMRTEVNPTLNLLGFLITMFSARTAIHRAYESMLRELYGSDVLETTIPHAIDFKEAIAQRKPVPYSKPRGASAKALKALAEELKLRMSYTVQNADPGEARGEAA